LPVSRPGGPPRLEVGFPSALAPLLGTAVGRAKENERCNRDAPLARSAGSFSHPLLSQPQRRFRPRRRRSRSGRARPLVLSVPEGERRGTRELD